MFIWDDILVLVSITTALCSGFKFIVINPLKEAIKQNTSLLEELKHELQQSALDRRMLDKRISALEALHKVNEDRLAQLEKIVHRLESSK